jgi:hypothetical protein
MSGSALSQRLAAFRQNFKQILGPKRQGYDELAQLESPLIGSSSQEEPSADYVRKHGVARPGSGGGGGAAAGTGAPAGQTHIPSQTEELQLLVALGREAAEILWEMAALQDETEATKEMLEKGELLQAQLRGMIGDYKGGDETILASALEVFDLLSNTLSEYHTATSPKAVGSAAAPFAAGGYPTGAAPASRLQPPPSSREQNPFQANPFQAGTGQAAPGKKPDEEAPLISFD